MGYKSATKILNDVYTGESLNVNDYGSATKILNLVADGSGNALKVNISGPAYEPLTGATTNANLYYENDTLFTPKIELSDGSTPIIMKDISTSDRYKVYIENGELKTMII